MRIGIDARPLALEAYTGIPRAVYEITKHWLDHHPEHEYYMLSSMPVHFVKELPPNWHILDKPGMIDNQKFWALFELPKLIKDLKLDVFWGSNYLLPRKLKGTGYCVTVYDLAIFKIPDVGESYSTFRLRLFGKSSCKRADRIVAISRATAEDIHSLFGIRKSRISISYCGGLPESAVRADGKGGDNTVDDTADDTVRPELLALESGGFFLFVSTIEPRKNLLTLIHAFEEYKRRELPSKDGKAGRKLILAGGRGWKYEEILDAVDTSPWKSEILMPGYISDKEKEWLLKRAEAFVYPSLYEGFGIPVLEAMSYGCPVITSAVSSLPEVGGDAALYISDPRNVDELAERMEEICGMRMDELIKLKKKMQIQSGKFSWKKNSEEMLKILCRLK